MTKHEGRRRSSWRVKRLRGSGLRGMMVQRRRAGLTLALFVARVALADDAHDAAALHDFAVHAALLD